MRNWVEFALAVEHERGLLKVTARRGSELLERIHLRLVLRGAVSGAAYGAIGPEYEILYLPATVEAALNDVIVLELGGPAPTGMPATRRSFRWVERIALIVPRTLRRRVLVPALEDLRIDRAEAMQRFRGRWERRWVRLVFSLRAAFCVAATVRVGLLHYAARCLPARWRRWWLT